MCTFCSVIQNYQRQQTTSLNALDQLTRRVLLTDIHLKRDIVPEARSQKLALSLSKGQALGVKSRDILA